MAKRKSAQRAERDFQYDVCLSFAGDDRRYVKAVAKELISKYEHGDEHLGKSFIVVLEWHYLGVDYSDNATIVAYEMIDTATSNYCDEHADEVLKRLDFSSLSSATIIEHKH